MRTRTMCQSLRAFLLFPESEQAARYELRGARCTRKLVGSRDERSHVSFGGWWVVHYGQVMAYVNVAEWKTDQVCEWLKGTVN